LSPKKPFLGPGQRQVEEGRRGSKSAKAAKPAKSLKSSGNRRREGLRAAAGVSGELVRGEERSPAQERGNWRREEWGEVDGEAGNRNLAGERRVSVVWLKNVVGVFLLPVAWVWTLTVFGALSRETLKNRFWQTEDFWFFGLGVVLWMVWFTGSLYMQGAPRPMRVYVFGHELTHAIWTWLSIGRVSDFKVSKEGGHIVTDSPNIWVTLSPYFYPVYCVALLLLFGVASFFYDFKVLVPEGQLLSPLRVVFMLLGAAWAFHLSFTVWMIRRGQSDLRMHGNFFSLVLIYIMNLVVLSVFLVLTAPGVGVGSICKDLLENSAEVAEGVWRGIMYLKSQW
jgi:hypothetical protein